MHGVRERMRACGDLLEAGTQLGIHARQRRPMPVANSILAVEPGVTGVDTSLAEHDAGAGSCAIEVFNAVANLLGWKYGRGLFALQDAADDSVRPLRERPLGVDREARRSYKLAPTQAFYVAAGTAHATSSHKPAAD